jgi:hypothetical protein
VEEEAEEVPPEASAGCSGAAPRRRSRAGRVTPRPTAAPSRPPTHPPPPSSTEPLPPQPSPPPRAGAYTRPHFGLTSNFVWPAFGGFSDNDG